MNSRHHSGAAIIAALLVVALVAALGARLMLTQEIWLNQTDARYRLDSTREIAHASLHWARAILYDDGRRSQVDHAGEAWAQPLPATTFDDATLAGQLEDAQGKFNLNTLVQDGKANDSAVAAFTRLLNSLNLAPSLADALIDWMDADTEPVSPQGAEIAYYAARPSYPSNSNRNAANPSQPPIQLPAPLPNMPPNASLGSLEELLWIRGYDFKTLQTLRPYVAALPVATTVNVNTAAAEVLSAIVPRLSLSRARQLVAERATGHFESLDEFKAHLMNTERENLENIGIASQFFLAHGEIRLEQTVYRIDALLQRQDAQWPRIVWQRQQ